MSAAPRPWRARGPWTACPVDVGHSRGCGRWVRPGQLMCGHHWHVLPVDVQRRVWRAWRAYCRDMTEKTWQGYVDARDEALGELVGVP